MVNISGIVSKVAGKADLIGGLLGFATGSMGGFNDVKSSIENVMQGQIHIPDVGRMLDWWFKQPYLKNALYLWAAGFAAQELKLPVVAKYGNAMKKFAEAYAGGSFANHVLWWSTHSDQGSSPGGNGFPSLGATATYPY